MSRVLRLPKSSFGFVCLIFDLIWMKLWLINFDPKSVKTNILDERLNSLRNTNFSGGRTITSKTINFVNSHMLLTRKDLPRCLQSLDSWKIIIPNYKNQPPINLLLFTVFSHCMLSIPRQQIGPIGTGCRLSIIIILSLI